VPLAVWPCVPLTPDPPVPAGICPPLLAQRLLAVYSHPGQVVLTAGTGARLIADHAQRLDRHPIIDHGPTAPTLRPPGPARARLAVITPPATADPARYTRWARALDPAGILAVHLPTGHGPDALRPGRIVAAATAAGLGYLQHIIAVTARITGDRLIPAATPEQIARAQAAHTAGLPIHLDAHADVLVFHKPPPPSAAANQAATPVAGRTTAAPDIEEEATDAHAA